MLGIIIFVIIVGAIIGIFLAFVIAPIVVLQDKKRLKEIDQKINAFENRAFSTPEEKEKEKQLLKKELIKLKAKISSDKGRKEEAGDKINIL